MNVLTDAEFRFVAQPIIATILIWVFVWLMLNTAAESISATWTVFKGVGHI